MGFSVSGSFVVVLLGLFIALGTVYTSGANTMERLASAQADQAQRFDRVHHTGVNVTSVSLLTGVACGIEVKVNNTGSTTLALNDTTLLFNNTVMTDWRSGTSSDVDGDADAHTWAPGEQLVITNDDLLSAPNSVTIVTATGVADRRETEGLLC